MKGIDIRKDNEARANMATVFFEDDRVRNESQFNSEQYLLRIDEENGMPVWMWCLLYFILGALAMISVDSVFYGLFHHFS